MSVSRKYPEGPYAQMMELVDMRVLETRAESVGVQVSLCAPKYPGRLMDRPEGYEPLNQRSNRCRGTKKYIVKNIDKA